VKAIMILSLKHSEMMLVEYALTNTDIVAEESLRQIVKILEKLRKAFDHRNDKLFMKYVIEAFIKNHNLQLKTYNKGGSKQ
jgi:hypothetical protein